MINILRIISFCIALFWLAMAVTLENINSAFVDFTQIPKSELPMFQFVFFGMFVAFMLIPAFLGD